MSTSPNTAAEPYFPPGSMLRTVQNERLVGLLYGFRAVLIGATHPVAFTGTYLHSEELDTPAGRLVDTALIFEDLILGTREQADRGLRITAAKHKKVTGTLGEAAGTWSAETQYSAYDPDLMVWTWAVLADSSITMYETLIRPLSDGDRERLYQGWVRWGELFRMPREAAPPTHADFQAWWQREMTSPERHLTEVARMTAEAIVFAPPLPLPLRGARPLIKLLVTGTTPAPIRELYGLTWTPLNERAFRATVAAARTGRLALPFAGTGSVKSFFAHIAAHERVRVARGHDTIPGIDRYLRERDTRIAAPRPAGRPTEPTS